MQLTHIFVPKNRRVDFELSILVHDLTNIPLVTGFYSIKWRLKHASLTYGATNRAPIKDHAVQWSASFQSVVHVVIGKDGLLQPCELRMDVIQELNGGRETENIGNLVINLSEYVGMGTTTRRYLLQDSKVNSKMKLSIVMKQMVEDVVFTVPPMKKQQIDADIPSIVTDRKEYSPSISQDDTSQVLQNNHPKYQPTGSSAHGMIRSHSTPSMAFLQQQTVNPAPFWRSSGDRSPTDLVEEIFLGRRVEDLDIVETGRVHRDTF